MPQTKSCLHCQAQFEITQADLNFYDKTSPTFAGEKFLIPIPTLCPDCRQRRRLSFRNERKLYKRTCDASGRDIISIYRPGSDYAVYDQKIRWSDDRDPMKYGRDFDFTKSFTEQFGELMRVVPHMSLSSDNCEGCDFTNFTLNSKQCYFLFGGGNDEKVLYSDFVNGSHDSIELMCSSNCEYCYECINCHGCYDCKYSINCNNGNNLIGCVDCESCSYCYQSSGLHNASYYFENQKYEKDEYLEKIKHIRIGNHLYMRSLDTHIINSEGCDGYNIIASKNCIFCSDIMNGENLRFCSFVPNANNSYDLDFMAPYGSEYGYELCTSTGTKYSLSTYLSRLCIQCYYCYECRSCEYCFGCIGLRNKQYCIFNKQYTKEEYEILVGKIIRHMMQPRRDALLARPGESYTERGEFFHPSLSPFGYNETVAQEYYPLLVDPVGTRPALSDTQQNKTVLFDSKLSNTNDDGRGKPTFLQIDYSTFGYHRSTYVAPTPQVDKVIKGSELPNMIDEITDDILRMAVLCEVSNKPFRITPQELAFYRKHHIPLPRKHPDVRHEERMKLRM